MLRLPLPVYVTCGLVAGSTVLGWFTWFTTPRLPATVCPHIRHAAYGLRALTCLGSGWFGLRLAPVGCNDTRYPVVTAVCCPVTFAVYGCCPTPVYYPTTVPHVAAAHVCRTHIAHSYYYRVIALLCRLTRYTLRLQFCGHGLFTYARFILPLYQFGSCTHTHVWLRSGYAFTLRLLVLVARAVCHAHSFTFAATRALPFTVCLQLHVVAVYRTHALPGGCHLRLHSPPYTVHTVGCRIPHTRGLPRGLPVCFLVSARLRFAVTVAVLPFTLVTRCAFGYYTLYQLVWLFTLVWLVAPPFGLFARFTATVPTRYRLHTFTRTRSVPAGCAATPPRFITLVRSLRLRLRFGYYSWFTFTYPTFGLRGYLPVCRAHYLVGYRTRLRFRFSTHFGLRFAVCFPVYGLLPPTRRSIYRDALVLRGSTVTVCSCLRLRTVCWLRYRTVATRTRLLVTGLPRSWFGSLYGWDHTRCLVRGLHTWFVGLHTVTVYGLVRLHVQLPGCCHVYGFTRFGYLSGSFTVTRFGCRFTGWFAVGYTHSCVVGVAVYSLPFPVYVTTRYVYARLVCAAYAGLRFTPVYTHVAVTLPVHTARHTVYGYGCSSRLRVTVTFYLPLVWFARFTFRTFCNTLTRLVGYRHRFYTRCALRCRVPVAWFTQLRTLRTRLPRGYVYGLLHGLVLPDYGYTTTRWFIDLRLRVPGYVALVLAAVARFGACGFADVTVPVAYIAGLIRTLAVCGYVYHARLPFTHARLQFYRFTLPRFAPGCARARILHTVTVYVTHTRCRLGYVAVRLVGYVYTRAVTFVTRTLRLFGLLRLRCVTQLRCVALYTLRVAHTFVYVSTRLRLRLIGCSVLPRYIYGLRLVWFGCGWLRCGCAFYVYTVVYTFTRVVLILFTARVLPHTHTRYSWFTAFAWIARLVYARFVRADACSCAHTRRCIPVYTRARLHTRLVRCVWFVYWFVWFGWFYARRDHLRVIYLPRFRLRYAHWTRALVYTLVTFTCCGCAPPTHAFTLHVYAFPILVTRVGYDCGCLQLVCFTFGWLVLRFTGFVCTLLVRLVTTRSGWLPTRALRFTHHYHTLRSRGSTTPRTHGWFRLGYPTTFYLAPRAHTHTLFDTPRTRLVPGFGRYAHTVILHTRFAVGSHTPVALVGFPVYGCIPGLRYCSWFTLVYGYVAGLPHTTVGWFGCIRCWFTPGFWVR